MHLFSQTLMGLAAVALAGGENGAGDPAGNPTAGLLDMLWPMVLMIAVFYFLLIRPQRKRDKKEKAMLAALEVGDTVCTVGGIYGTITSIKDDIIEVSVGKDNVKLVFARLAIRKAEEDIVKGEGELLN